MAKLVMYSRGWCPFCFRAKSLLESSGIEFEEIDLEDHPEREAEMLERSGGRDTVPQIFVGGVHVGGSDDLARIAVDGGLRALLEADDRPVE